MVTSCALLPGYAAGSFVAAGVTSVYLRSGPVFLGFYPVVIPCFRQCVERRASFVSGMI